MIDPQVGHCQHCQLSSPNPTMKLQGQCALLPSTTVPHSMQGNAKQKTGVLHEGTLWWSRAAQSGQEVLVVEMSDPSLGHCSGTGAANGRKPIETNSKLSKLRVQNLQLRPSIPFCSPKSRPTRPTQNLHSFLCLFTVYVLHNFS